MYRIQNLMIILVILLCFSCEKELDITDFKEEFGNYHPELKIEGLLQQDNPQQSIVRIIKSSAITDNELYNGLDDDGDGDVDEEDEIIAQVQDTSASVKVIHVETGEEFLFTYVARADSLIRYMEEDDGKEEIEIIPYGGYKPDSPDFKIEVFSQYRIEIHSTEFNKTVTGITTVYPAVQFIDTLFSIQNGSLLTNINDIKEIFWTSDPNVSAYYVTVDEGYNIANDEWHFEYIYSFASSRDIDLSKQYENASVGRTIILVSSDAVLRLTVEALSPEYGRYIFSDLPLSDPERSNLRDEDGNPVMGCFGARAATSIFVIIEE